MTVNEFINAFGGTEQCISFCIMGVAALIHAHKGSTSDKRRRAYLFGIWVLFSGISRGIGVFAAFHGLDGINGIFKVISGTAGIISCFFLSRGIKELSSVQTVQETKREIDDTNEKIDHLKDIAEQINVRNTNRPQ